MKLHIARIQPLRLVRLLTLLVAINLVTSSSLQAQNSIGINFIGGQEGNMVPGAEVAGTAGVPAIAQPNWNNLGLYLATGTAEDLVDNSNVATTLDISWNSANTWSSGNNADGNDDSNLMDGYLDATTGIAGGRSFVDLSDVPYDFYDVYVYVGSDGDGRTGFTDINNIGGTAIWFSTSTSNATFTGPESYVQATATTQAQAVASNYVVYQDLGFNNVQVGVTRGSNNTGIHGIQIVEELNPQGSLSVSVNRDTGNITLENGSQTPISMAAYSLLSAGGALNSSNWDSIADNPIDGNTWFKLSTAPDELAEGTLGSSTIGVGESVDFGDGLWTKYYQEDVLFQYLDPNTDELADISVFFDGNNDQSFEFGDLDFNNTIDLVDWGMVRDNFNSTFAGMSAAQSYALGDLDGDADNDLDDLLSFKNLYENLNGAGSFATLISGVPEPSTALLCMLACTWLGAMSQRRRSGERRGAAAYQAGMRVLVVGVAIFGLSASLHAQQAININFIAGQNPTPGASVEGPAGVVPLSNWNNVSELSSTGAAANVIDSNNNVTGVSASWVASSTWASGNAGDGNEDSNLMDGYIDVTTDLPGGRMFIDLADIPYSFYDVYVYVGSDGDGRTAFTDINNIPSTATWFITNSGGATFTGPESYVQATATTEATAFAANYVVYEDLGFEDLQIGLTRGSNNAGVHGLQIIEDLDPALLTLRVGSNGATSILNDTGADVDVDYYEIASDSERLSLGGWSSLESNPQGLGDGWEELGNLDSNLLAEFYLEGSSVLVDQGSPISLGSAVLPGTTDGVSFRYHVAGGITSFGKVEYFMVGDVDGDYNGDGVVNAADYVRWRNGGPLLNEVMTPGMVTQEDYDYWVSRFGATSGSGSGSAGAVPEPATAALLSIVAVLGLCRLRTRAVSLTLLACLAMVGLAGITPTADAALTLDRDYELGEASGEGGTDGQPVGDPQFGLTFDSVGTGGAGDLQDLTPNNNPTYVDVTTGGSPRPFTSVSGLESTLGVQFGGSNYLSGSYATGAGGLGLPSASNPDTQGGVDFSAPNPAANYRNITNRGMQLWVKPNNNNGMRWDVINDTYQYGIFISPAGTWGINHGSFPDSGNSQSFTSDVPVDFNQWSHVDLHSFGQGLGVLYLNGVAIMTDAGSFASVQDHGTAGENLDISVGANLTGTGNFLSGQVDHIKIYVNGDNTDTGEAGAMDYGTFNVATDNDYLRGLLDGLNVADVNLDGAVNGNGMGPVESDDVSAFIAGYGFRKLLDGNTIPDRESREKGDLDLNGVVNLLDWAILRNNHAGGASLDLGSLLNGNVPEPTSAALLAAAIVASCGFVRRRG